MSTRTNEGMKNNSNNDSTDPASGSSGGISSRRTTEGRFLYADYTPIHDANDRPEKNNLIESLKAFVSMSSRLTKIYAVDGGLSTLTANLEPLQSDIVSAITQAKSQSASAIESFENKHLEDTTFKSDREGIDLLNDSKSLLLKRLDAAQTDYLSNQRKYREHVIRKRIRNRDDAITLVHEWLSADYLNLPSTILASLVAYTEIFMNPVGGSFSEPYSIRRVASATFPSLPNSLPSAETKDTSKNNDQGVDNATAAASSDSNSSGDKPSSESSQLSYAIAIQSTKLEFWGKRRTVSDLGIKDFMMPVGMKAPLSERLKHAFKLELDDPQRRPAMEPEFRKLDDFYITAVEWRGQKILTVQLASDATLPYSHLFTLMYDLDENGNLVGMSGGTSSSPPAATPTGNPSSSPPPSRTSMTSSTQDKGIRIKYKKKKDDGSFSEITDILQEPEISGLADYSMITMFGKAVLSKLQNIVESPSVLLSKGRLEFLRLGESAIISTSTNSTEQPASVNFLGLFEFLMRVASAFRPIIKKLQERTPLKQEIIIREELAGQKRREYAAKLEDLRSQLGNSAYGRQILVNLLEA